MVAAARAIVRGETASLLVAGARPEVKLLLLCADPAANVNNEHGEIASLLEANLDWEWMLEQGARHALLPLIWWKLKDQSSNLIPSEAQVRLQSDFRRTRIRNLFIIEELRRLLRVFDEHDISVIPIKGPILALNYPDIALRSFNDLDLVVRPQDIERATAALNRLGYHRHRTLTADKEAFLLAKHNQRAFADSAGRLTIELHWKLFCEEKSRAFPSARMYEKLTTCVLPRGDRPVHVLSAENTLLYLCVHAALSMYERVNWITDIAVHLRANSQLDWEKVFALAEAGGERRALSLGLFLASELLHVKLPSPVAKRIEVDVAVRRLASVMCAGFWNRVPVISEPLTSLNMCLLLREHGRDKWRLLVWAFMRPSLADLETISLPHGLKWLYPAVRIGRMMKKRRTARRASHDKK